MKSRTLEEVLEIPQPPSSLTQFIPVSTNAVQKVINKAPTKSSLLDPIPTWLLKSCLDELLPPVTDIVNSSLRTGVVPSCFKSAVVTPVIKKSGLGPELYKNYRPISNLSFLSKVLERVVAIMQLQQYLQENSLYSKMQSAYRKHHSTETALIRVTNDLLSALDRGKEVVLILLDLSAAFDTIAHAALLSRLKAYFGIQDTALAWFKSYLEGRQQSVSINGTMSETKILKCGVPQGSVLGPILFIMYTAPLENLIKSHNLDCMMYADDTQLFLSFDPKQLGATCDRVNEWMVNGW